MSHLRKINLYSQKDLPPCIKKKVMKKIALMKQNHKIKSRKSPE